MTLRLPKILGELWQRYIMDAWQGARERKRIARSDNIRHALAVLEDLRNWNLDNERSKA
jgi:hypothetical protein